jgi:ankyrin repeat protein
MFVPQYPITWTSLHVNQGFDVKTRRRNYLLALIPILLFMGVGCWLIWRFLFGPGDLLDAVQRGKYGKASLLTYLGVSPNSEIFLVGGVIHCTAAEGQTEAMAKLLEMGANVNRLDGYGVTPAHVAVQFHQLEAFRWLLAHGADPSIKDRRGRTLAECIPNDLPEQEREGFLSALKEASNQQGGANGRQPFSSETNRASAAAASRRSP